MTEFFFFDVREIYTFLFQAIQLMLQTHTFQLMMYTFRASYARNLDSKSSGQIATIISLQLSMRKISIQLQQLPRTFYEIDKYTEKNFKSIRF